MAVNIPNLGSYGIFTLLPPFTITNVNYKCVGLDLFSSLIEKNVDVYNSYYAPNKISHDKYVLDLNNNAAIVILESVDGPIINVPSPYVNDIPVEVAVPYNRVILSLDLGELPGSLDFTLLLNDLLDMANNHVGVTTKPNLHAIPSGKVYTHHEHLIKETARLALVSQYVSFYTGKLAAEAEVAKLRKQVNMLSECVVLQKNKINSLENP